MSIIETDYTIVKVKKWKDKSGRIHDLELPFKMYVPLWISRENYTIRKEMIYVTETRKAILLVNKDGYKVWLPKSVVEIEYFDK